MPIRWKTNMLTALKDAGYSTYKLRKERVFGEDAIQNLRNGKLVSLSNMEKLCELLHCQPGDILEYVENNQEGSAEHGQL